MSLRYNNIIILAPLCSVYENPLFAERRVMKFGQKGWESNKYRSAASNVCDEDDFNIINFTEDEEKQFDI